MVEAARRCYLERVYHPEGMLCSGVGCVWVAVGWYAVVLNLGSHILHTSTHAMWMQTACPRPSLWTARADMHRYIRAWRIQSYIYMYTHIHSFIHLYTHTQYSSYLWHCVLTRVCNVVAGRHTHARRHPPARASCIICGRLGGLPCIHLHRHA